MNFIENRIQTGLSPIIKWAGGKEKELSFIFPNAPKAFNRYYEPFVGGGSVFMATPAKKYIINDKSQELIDFYGCIADQDETFYQWVDRIIESWGTMLAYVASHSELCDIYKSYRSNELSDSQICDWLNAFVDNQLAALELVLPAAFIWHRDVYISEIRKNLTRKLIRMKRIEAEKHELPDSDVYDNIETAFMSSLYMYYRALYNDQRLMASEKSLSSAVFLFIRNYAYSGMFRYNDKGEFNVPYGGIAYNHKMMTKKIDYYKSDGLIFHFSNTEIYNLDFEDFFRENPPAEDDFIFLDPPYDSEFSTYAKNVFSKADQERLANYLINECKAKWMMIIKNTPFIYSLYDHSNLRIKTFDKKYLVSFMNRNDKKAEHLIIMNYDER